MSATGFSNTFTSGEIAKDAWDRVDLQPVSKGCEAAINYVVRVAGPLGKRRGFWDIDPVTDEAHTVRLVPFRKSFDDAFLLVFSDVTARVWQTDGSPLMDGGGPPAQVTFVTPYTEAQLAGLRWKQIGDVIYFRHRDGLPPQTLVRHSNTFWSFQVETFTGGPWLPENIDDAFTISASKVLAGDTGVALTATKPLFDPGMVGTTFKLRGRIASLGVMAWSPAYDLTADTMLVVSNGRIYADRTTANASDKIDTGTNPPVHDRGTASDGYAQWEYIHDGAGIIQLTAVADNMHATGTILRTLPTEGILRGPLTPPSAPTLAPGDDPPLPATPFWAECAYSNFRGWPRMWPTMREERLVDGATLASPDFIDLTQTAGFTPTSQSFIPGLGTGTVLATDAIRRRVGTDGGELIWAEVGNYLVCGSTSGEHLIAGSVLNEAIEPGTVKVSDLSAFGSEDVFPAKAHKGLLYVTRGGKTLREMVVDAQQDEAGTDLTVLAGHISGRRFAQLAWVAQPDETLWARLGDGGIAAFTYHQEQQVRGWTRQLIPGGWVCEDMAVLPGPGRQETLWLVVARVKGGVTQRRLWQQSEAGDALFMDGAGYYSGAPVSSVGGLAHYEGETLRVLADGVQSQVVVIGGAVALTVPASLVYAGLGLVAHFRSLKLAPAQLGFRQLVTNAIVTIDTALAKIGADPGGGVTLWETFSTRERADIPAASAKTQTKDVNFAAGHSRDPRIEIVDETAYDCVIYSIRPMEPRGG